VVARQGGNQLLLTLLFIHMFLSISAIGANFVMSKVKGTIQPTALALASVNGIVA
jgi:hypothetical protein